MKKHADSIDAAILDRIRSGVKDYVWTPADFLDLGSRAAVDKALSRNVKSGQLRRAGRGLYHILRQHPILGDLVAPDYQLHDAICRRVGSRIYSTGAHAANALGLSDQVHQQLQRPRPADRRGFSPRTLRQRGDLRAGCRHADRAPHSPGHPLAQSRPPVRRVDRAPRCIRQNPRRRAGRRNQLGGRPAARPPGDRLAGVAGKPETVGACRANQARRRAGNPPVPLLSRTRRKRLRCVQYNDRHRLSPTRDVISRAIHLDLSDAAEIPALGDARE